MLSNNFKIAIWLICLTLLWLFPNTVHSQPQLWGMTSSGGNQFGGAIFTTDVNGDNLTQKFSFDEINGSYENGLSPNATLTYFNGFLYGITQSGGQHGKGTIFKIDAGSGNFHKVWDFSGIDGENSWSSFTLALNGMLYSLTGEGGAHNRGTLIAFDPSLDTLIKLFDFDSINGSNPYGELLLAENGKIYGMAGMGGTHDKGVIFEFDISTNVLSKIIDFDGTNGSYPSGTLVQSSYGKIYGTTSDGGTFDMGVIFELDPTTNSLSVLRSLNSQDGSFPQGGLTMGDYETLLGVALMGGNNNSGTIFSYHLTSHTFNTLFHFQDSFGIFPAMPPFLSSNGKFYGMTYTGGNFYHGVLYEYNIDSNIFKKKLDFNGQNGSAPTFNNLIEAYPVRSTGEISGDSITCAGSILTYEVDELHNVVYEWGLPSGFTLVSGDSSHKITVTAPNSITQGTISVRAKNMYGYGPTSYLDVIVANLPIVSAHASSIEICYGDSLVLTGTGAESYTWNHGVTNGVAFLQTSTMTYTLIGTDSNGCSAADSIQILVNPLPIVTFSLPNDRICIEQTALVLEGGLPTGGFYSGNGVAGNIFFPSEAGLGKHTITYSFTDSHGCLNSDSQMVTVEVCTSIKNPETHTTAYITRTFINETILIISSPEQAIFKVEVMELTGRIVWTGHKLLNTGTHKILLDLPNKNGFYILNLESKGFQKRLKF